MLRQYTAGDAVAIFDLISRNRDHLSRDGETTALKYGCWLDVMRSIMYAPNPQRLRFGLWHGDVLIGTRNIQINNDGTAETGSYLGAQYQGKGYMRKAMNRMVQFAFEDLKLREIYSVIAETNVRSINLVTKAGFVQDKHRKIPAAQETPAKLYFVKTNNTIY